MATNSSNVAVKPAVKRRTKSGDNIAAEMSKVARSLAQLETTAQALREREKALAQQREQQGARRVAAAFLKQKFGDISDAQATALAKRVSALGIAGSLEKLL